MEKIWHKKKKTRILLIIIANVMVISMMLGVMSIMSYAELFDDLITGKLTQSYEDSYDFDTELMNSAYQVMSGIDSEQMFETDGKIDEDKLVDIQVYNNSETISGQNESGLSYRLGDLLNWYQKLIYSESTSYVGDTNTDMQTGNAAHMHPVGVLWGFRDRKELEENHSEYVIEKPQELIAILEKINGGDNK